MLFICFKFISGIFQFFYLFCGILCVITQGVTLHAKNCNAIKSVSN
nr:MAG TPA: hypothetical protein [Bacteriophage sp.]